MIPVIADATAEQRWNAWKRDGAIREIARKDRMRKLLAAICFGAVIWLLAGNL